MRNRSFVVPLALLAVLGLAACDNSAEKDAEQAERDPAAGSEMETETAEQRSAATEEQPTTERDAMAERDPAMAGRDPAMGGSQPGQGETALTVEDSQQFGEYLADSEGRPLYVYEQDNPGESTCYDACAEAWPPLTADQGMPLAEDPNIREDMLGTIQRDDGTTQITYDGQPLYYYAQDQAGEPQGQNVEGQWYLASVDGGEVRRVSEEM